MVKSVKAAKPTLYAGTDPAGQPSEALRTEHSVVGTMIDTMDAIVRRWPDETSIEEMLSSVMANVMIREGHKPVKWLEKVGNLAFKKRNIFWQQSRQ
jgi:hypothetical protein